MIPHDITPIIGIPIPIFLENALGYLRDRRYVAFWWDIYTDTIVFQDDRISLKSEGWTAWMLFIKHPKISKYIQGYNLGSSDREADYALLLDRNKRQLYVGEINAIKAFLSSNEVKSPNGPNPTSGQSYPRDDSYERLECWLDTL